MIVLPFALIHRKQVAQVLLPHPQNAWHDTTERKLLNAFPLRVLVVRVRPPRPAILHHVIVHVAFLHIASVVVGFQLMPGLAADERYQRGPVRRVRHISP